MPPPPPPSQAGRFKPRKPGKKIRVGVTGVGAQPDAVGSSTAEAGPSAATATSTAARGSGGDRGSSNKRRGGRGRGRGGGRAPPQQGQVFFTAQQAPSTTSKRSSKGAALRSAANAQQQQSETGAAASGGSTTASVAAAASKRAIAADSARDEEVVGEVDGGGVGAAAATASGKKKTPDAVLSAASPPPELETAANSRKISHAITAGGEPASFYYASDSSDEEDLPSAAGASDRFRRQTKLQPLTLPFPGPVAPEGIGGNHGNDPMDMDTTTTTASNAPATVTLPRNTAPSPFCSVDNLIDLQAENDSWFLVQLPTRLPPLRKSSTQDADFEDAPQQQPPPTKFADVATPPVQAHAFDNVLSQVKAPGKVGKILVYKSGKTVLVLESSSLSSHDQRRPVVQMNVTEGLTCSFRQQAVAIDEVSKDFTPLGKVVKTIVVTPGGLDQSFSS